MIRIKSISINLNEPSIKLELLTPDNSKQPSHKIQANNRELIQITEGKVYEVPIKTAPKNINDLFSIVTSRVVNLLKTEPQRSHARNTLSVIKSKVIDPMSHIAPKTINDDTLDLSERFTRNSNIQMAKQSAQLLEIDFKIEDDEFNLMDMLNEMDKQGDREPSYSIAYFNKVKEQLEWHTREVQMEIERASSEIRKLNQTRVELEINISSIKKELQAIITNANEMNSRVEDVADENVAMFQIMAESKLQKIDESLTNCQEKEKSLIETHDSLKSMMNTSAEKSLSENYSKTAKSNFIAYISILFLIVTICTSVIAIAAFSWSNEIKQDVHWATYLGRVSITAVSIFVMSFLAKQAAEQKRIYEDQKMKAAELSILTPFLSEYTNEELKAIKKTLIPRYFNSTTSPPPEQDTEELKNLLSALPTALEPVKDIVDKVVPLLKSAEASKTSEKPPTPPTTPST